MAFVSYLVPFALIVLLWAHNMIPLAVVFHFGIYAVGINTLFLLVIHFRLNLKFQEPSLTAQQMAASILPALWVLYFLDEGQARASVMLVVVVPLLFGILALNIRRFIKVGVWFFFTYCVTMAMLWRNKPDALVMPLEFVQTMAFILVLVSSSIIGGFIHGLRGKLRQRNLELQEAMAKIEEMANLDSLTGIWNRRRLFHILSQEANRFSRAHAPFSVCLMDIDHFKQVNDAHGHQAGDEILRLIAREISGNLRCIDCFGRYGGEEFLMVLPQTTLEGATVKAERVRQQVESLRFPDISENFRVTISIGVAEYRVEEDIDDTLARADKCLYAAKDLGRNRILTEKELVSEENVKEAGNGKNGLS